MHAEHYFGLTRESARRRRRHAFLRNAVHPRRHR
jgi:hypothetical protein